MDLSPEAARAEYERLQAMEKVFYVPQDVARILSVGSYAINLQAHSDAQKLGFPVLISGRRIRIPRAAFLDYLERHVLGLKPVTVVPENAAVAEHRNLPTD